MKYLFALIFFFCSVSITSAQVFNGLGGNINSFSLLTSNINVTGVGIIDCEIKVCVDIVHTWDADLEISIQSPNGTTINLSSDNGGGGDNYQTTCFTMDADINITSILANPPFNGDFIPEGNLSNFIGQNANGIWTLNVYDDAFGDIGVLNNWSLDFSCNPSTSDCEDGEDEYTLTLFDYWGDGWNTPFYTSDHTLTVNGIEYGSDFTSGYSEEYDICLPNCYDIFFTADGSYPTECSFNITSNSGEVVYSGNYNSNPETIGDLCGCIDPTACNYDPDVEEDDGSCFYSPLTLDDCEVIYCDSESGEQMASQYITTSINYLNIDITDDGIINELFYDINWHSHGNGNINFNVNNATVALYDENDNFIQNFAVIGNNIATFNYQNFSSIITPNISVSEGYTIRVMINSPNWGLGTWASYVNLAQVSFTIVTETLNAGDDATLEICYNDTPVDLFNLLGSDVDQNGTWSPALSGGYLGTFIPQDNVSGLYTYTVQGECLTDEATVSVNEITLNEPEIITSEDSICFGTSSVNYSVNSNAGSSYSWSVLGGNIVGAMNGNSIEVDWSLVPGSIPDAVVLTEYSNGCSISSSMDALIIPNPIPSLTIDDNEICIGESVTISADATYSTYDWTPSMANTSSLIYTPNSILENQVSVIVTGDGGCTTSETIDFTINDLPVVNLSANDADICLGDSIVVSSNPGYNNYAWTPVTILSNTDVYFPSSSSEDMIYLTVTTVEGCTNSDSLAILIYDLPNINLSVDDSEICIGESISLSTTAGYDNYNWTPSSISSNSDTYIPTSLNDNQIAVTITSDSGCSASDSLEITIYDLPIVNLAIDDTDLCMGDSLVVSSEPGYNNYAWTPAAISGNTDVYYPISSDENLISLTITGEGGCTSSESLDIVVNDTPIVNLSVDDSEICLGESIAFNTTAGYNDYNWIPSSISSNTDVYTPTTVDDNQFIVTITGQGGCTTSDSVQITINPLPVVEVSFSDSIICLGETIAVNATPGFINYDWTPASLNTVNTITPTLAQNNYSVVVTDNNGCVSSEDANLVVNPVSPLDLTVNGNVTTIICIGEEINLSATNGFDSYTWSIAGLSSSQVNYTPLDFSDNQFSVVGTNEFGCTTSASLNITINSIPTPSPIAVFSDSIQTLPLNLCEGVNGVKFSSIVSSETNPTNWVFISGNGAVIENGQNTSELEVSFPEVENYILEFREYGSVNCYTPQQIEFRVNPNPIIDFSFVEDCYKDSILFTNNSIVDTTIQSVSWLVDDLTFNTYDLTYPLDNNSKTFELTIVDVLNCSSSLTSSFVPSERPKVDFYYEPEKITILDPVVSFVNLSSNEDMVSWSFGDNQTSEEWAPIHTYDSLGWFEVILKVQNNEGCADSIAKQLLIENDLIYYFPSSFTPDGDGLNDVFGINGFRVDKIQEYQFRVTNRWGDMIFYSEDVNAVWDGKNAKGNDAMPGSYLWSVRIIDELGKVTTKYGDFTLLR